MSEHDKNFKELVALLEYQALDKVSISLDIQDCYLMVELMLTGLEALEKYKGMWGSKTNSIIKQATLDIRKNLVNQLMIKVLNEARMLKDEEPF